MEGSYQAKLADFGISAFIPQGRHETGKYGTDGYMAPEIINGAPYDFKADVFSAGVVLYML